MYVCVSECVCGCVAMFLRFSSGSFYRALIFFPQHVYESMNMSSLYFLFAASLPPDTQFVPVQFCV